MKRLQGESQFNRWVRSARAWFPERQLIVRTNGQIRYLKVSETLQVSCLAALVVAIGWGCFVSVNYFLIGDILRSKDEEISAAHTNYRTLLNEVTDYQLRFVALTKELQKNHAMMLDLVETNATLQLNLRTTQGKLSTAHQQQAEILSAKNALRDKLASIEGELHGLNAKNFTLRNDLTTVTQNLQTIVAERNKTQETNAKLRTQVTQLEEEIGRLHAMETDVIQRLARRTHEGITFMERVFARAGLKADEFLVELASNARTPEPARDDEVEPEEGSEQADAQTSEAESDDENEVEIASERPHEMAIPRRTAAGQIGGHIGGQGGPFIAASPLPESREKLKASLVSLEEQLGRWEDLRQLLRAAPLPAPLDSYQVSSEFGKRRDPINNRWSMHYGVDLRAPFSSQVYATAPGVVSFAGSEGKYGHMVEIDHGMGFKTRYAHLSKIMVKPGQKVDTRDKIGLVGTSGRTTGAHVHYEVSHNGKPIDPMRFIRAGKYVYKRQ